MKSNLLNNVDIAFRLLDTYLLQTEPGIPDPSLPNPERMTRRALRMILEVVRDGLIMRRDPVMASAIYDLVGQEIAGYPETIVRTSPECDVALAVQRLLLPYQTA